MAGESSGLKESIVPGCSIQHQEDLVRCCGIELAQDAHELLQLRHQRGFRVEASSGVHNQHVGGTGLSGAECIVGNGSRVSSVLLPNQGNPQPLCPLRELFDGGGAEGIGSGKKRLLSQALPAPRQLRRRRCLPGPVHPHHEHHRGGRGELLRRRCWQQLQKLLPQQRLELLCRAALLAEVLEKALGELHPDIRTQQNAFELLQECLLRKVRATQELLKWCTEALPRVREPLGEHPQPPLKLLSEGHRRAAALNPAR
jgi:hypothetical protein